MDCSRDLTKSIPWKRAPVIFHWSLMCSVQGINNVYVNGDTNVTKTYPVAFTKFQLPMCVNHTANYSDWAYCTNAGTLTSVKIYATHEWMNLAVVAIGV